MFVEYVLLEHLIVVEGALGGVIGVMSGTRVERRSVVRLGSVRMVVES